VSRILVDADACPVKAEALRVAERHGVEIHYVANGGIRPVDHPLARMVYVPEGPDEADKWIAEQAGPADVVVTADVPLAAKCVATGAAVLNHTGEPFSPANIGQKLATRDLMADLRAADPFRQGGGKGFSRADRSRFLDALDRALRAARRGG